MSNINVKFTLHGGVDGVLRRKGIAKGGKAQKVLDSEVIRLCDPYVPFRTGTLKNSAMTATDIGSGIVEYNTPYAKKQYYYGRSNGLRGRYWFERMKKGNKERLKRLVIAAIQEGGK